jgi:hypothetical protein
MFCFKKLLIIKRQKEENKIMGKVKRSVLDKHYAREGDSGYFNFH